MQTHKIFTEELKAKLLGFLQSEKTKDALEKIKSSSESGRFKVVISTENQDRQGEIVEQEGLDVSFFTMNPVVLWAHDYSGLPIGACDKIEKVNGQWVAEGPFAPEDANPFAQQVRRLYDGGFLKAVSIGFIPKRWEGNTVKESELLEFSFVPVPANPFALSLEKSGFKVAELITCGLLLKADEPKEGDVCTMEDGTEGMMQMDGDGKLVCMAKKTTKPEPETEGKYIIIRVKDPEYFDPDSFRTIDISIEKGIKSTVGCKKGEYENGACKIGMEIQRYLFDKEKWTEDEAKKWVEDHKKSVEIEGKEKSGKVLSEKNRTLISSSVSTMEQSIAALKELLAATEPKGDEGKSAKTDDPNKRSSDAGSDSEEILNQYFFVKHVLRSVSTAVSDALGKTKIKIKK
ncbi:hypothetical protein HZB93_02090 [Candidatus Falkowbacteria bacterium]|nr:hypothetical protein [Candidatus Falkowbacteria bacterium]